MDIMQYSRLQKRGKGDVYKYRCARETERREMSLRALS